MAGEDVVGAFEGDKGGTPIAGVLTTGTTALVSTMEAEVANVGACTDNGVVEMGVTIGSCTDSDSEVDGRETETDGSATEELGTPTDTTGGVIDEMLFDTEGTTTGKVEGMLTDSVGRGVVGRLIDPMLIVGTVETKLGTVMGGMLELGTAGMLKLVLGRFKDRVVGTVRETPLMVGAPKVGLGMVKEGRVMLRAGDCRGSVVGNVKEGPPIVGGFRTELGIVTARPFVVAILRVGEPKLKDGRVAAGALKLGTDSVGMLNDGTLRVEIVGIWRFDDNPLKTRKQKVSCDS